MGSFRNLSIRSKILIPSVLMALALGVVLFAGISALNRQQAFLTLSNRISLERISQVDELSSLSARLQSDLLGISLLRYMNVAEAEISPLLEKSEQRLSDLDILFGEMLRKWELDPKEREILGRMQGPLEAFLEKIQQATETVSRNPQFGLLLARSAVPPFSQLSKQLDGLLEYQRKKILETEAESRRAAQEFQIATIGIALFTTVLALFLATWIGIRSIARPVQAVTQVMDELAAGNLSAGVGDLDRRDEIGSMARAVEVFRRNALEKEAAQLGLRLSEERHRVTLMSVGDGVIVADAAGRVELLNPTSETLTGWSQEEARGKELGEVFRIVHEKSRALLENPVARVIEEGRVVGLANHTLLIARDGEERPIADSGAPIRNEKGEITGVVLVFRDQTQERAAQAAVRESEEKFRNVYNTAALAFVTWDKETRVMDWNRKAEEVFGWSKSEVLGRSFVEALIPESDRPKIEDVVNAVVERRIPGYEIKTNLTKSRGVITCEWNHSMLHDDEGNVIGVISLGLDVTERKRMEEALKSSLEKYEKTFQAAPVWVVLSLLEDGRYLEVNEAFVRNMGYQREEVIGKTSLELNTWVDAEDRERVVAQIKERGGIRNAQVQRRTRSGEILDTLFSAETILLGGKRVMISISEDLTDQKKSEAAREKLQVQLVQAQKMESVGRLAGGVAHDFNNMLGVILGHTHLAMEHVDPASPMYADLEEIQKAAQRSADLTRQLLAFARRQTAQPKVLDLNDTVGGMLKMLRRLIGEDIDLAWMPGADLWPVKIDPAQVDQILANLCVNARDAISGVGKVTIETHNAALDEAYCSDHPECVPGRYVMLSVSDSGRGMDQETLKNLFEPFFTTKEVGEGTGLGLATVYGIVKQNNGFINVYSEPGQGATFKVYLQRTSETVETREETASQAVAKGTETVLLVEDEASILRLGKTVLERFGYTVLAAHTPSDALATAVQHPGPIHLLVTDVVMPEMNGKELAARIEALKPDIRILFMSGYTANVIVHRGILERDVHFLPKPFSVASLAGKVREVLDRG